MEGGQPLDQKKKGERTTHSGTGCRKYLGLLEKSAVGLKTFGTPEWQELPTPLVIDSGAGRRVGGFEAR